MSTEIPQPQQSDLGAELAKIQAELEASKQTANAAKQEAEESRAFMEGIQKAASGKQETPPPSPHQKFVDRVLTEGEIPVVDVVRRELQQQAYFDSLTNTWSQSNKHLEPLKNEIFGRTNQIIATAKAQGQNITWEDALKTSTNHYDDQHKRMMKLAGAEITPGSTAFGMPESRYAGCDKDFFAMNDKEFYEKEMKPRDFERKSRNRQALAHYGVGR